MIRIRARIHACHKCHAIITPLGAASRRRRVTAGCQARRVFPRLPSSYYLWTSGTRGIDRLGSAEAVDFPTTMAHVYSARRIRSMHRPLSERISCSQSRMTVQSAARKRRKFRWSRFLFVCNFDFQNSDNLCSHAGSRHPCQKSPSMKTATFFFEKTISGDPGNPLQFRWKRRPIFRSSRWTNASRGPSLSFTHFIA